MLVEAAIDAPLIFAGDSLTIRVSFTKTDDEEPPHLLCAYIMVQGSYRVGELMLHDRFASARQNGVVFGRHGMQYVSSSSGKLSSLFGGIKKFVMKDIDAADEYPLFSSAHQLLFADLTLGSTETYSVTVPIPAELPPSYKSRALTVSYHVYLSFQKLSNEGTPAVSQLFLPFRLLPGEGTFDLTEPVNSSQNPVEDENMEKYIESLLAHENAQCSFPSSAGSDEEMMSHQTHSSPVKSIFYTGKTTYEIAREGVPQAMLVLARPSFRVGDLITGELRLLVPCLHVTFHLELLETINPAYAAGVENSYHTYARESLTALALNTVALILPTNFAATPVLRTKQISVSWKLRIELVRAIEPTFKQSEAGLIANDEVETETVVCRIPLELNCPDAGGSGVSKTWGFD